MESSSTPHIRRAWTTDGGAHTRSGSRSYATHSSSTATEATGDGHGFDGPPQQAGKPPSLLRTAVSVLAAMQEVRRDRAQQRMQQMHTQARPSRSTKSSQHEQRRHQGQHDSKTRSNSSSSQENSASNRQRCSAYDGQEHRRRSNNHKQTSPERSTGQSAHQADVFDTAPANDSDRAELSRLRKRQHSLEDALDDAEDEISDCTRWLSRNAHRSDVSKHRVDDVHERLYEHKQRLKDIKDELKLVRTQRDEIRRRSSRPQPRRRRTAPSPFEHTAGTTGGNAPSLHNVEDIFNMLFTSTAYLHQRMASASRPAPSPHSQLFEHLFAGMATGSHFVFTNSRGQTFSQNFFTSDGPHFPQHTTRSSQAAPQTPVKAITVQEAQRLYEAYNRRWSTLEATDPAVPYPARGLKATALLARDSIAAPLMLSPIASWSTEDVVRANTHHFFLAVVGLSPAFRDHASKIEMDFEHDRNNASQLQMLSDMLKKEKLRWHSDKLGRRNNGTGAINTSLQEDEVVRAVFHAVCQLSDLVQSKRQGC